MYCSTFFEDLSKYSVSATAKFPSKFSVEIVKVSKAESFQFIRHFWNNINYRVPSNKSHIILVHKHVRF